MRYEDKDVAYYSNVRLDVVQLFPKELKNVKILEIGAGCGATLAFLKEKKIATEVVGIDLPINKHLPTKKNIDKFIYTDIQNTELPEYNNYFDGIILADVLEHLHDPLAVIKKVKKLLKKEGSFFISLPNIRHITAIYKIFVKGSFRYEKEGIFDDTHVRFFCKKDMITLMKNTDLNIETIVSALQMKREKSKYKTLNNLTGTFFEEFLTQQYLIRATPKL